MKQKFNIRRKPPSLHRNINLYDNINVKLHFLFDFFQKVFLIYVSNTQLYRYLMCFLLNV